ncbi:hypothetical protein K491DRAFT_691699 [Lophiostoma macrostomum CBS 122681]|uniref:Uncharacterized protein n=1 Tax=Lophiostoma macrostomum CBS 122681 TaxID=1314788 RepID=A0A6A6TC13_9PLEO|nr:hypothetical protein K491DRAFT_691699 [Lophiostoma macrostomum CBS 122681]
MYCQNNATNPPFHNPPTTNPKPSRPSRPAAQTFNTFCGPALAEDQEQRPRQRKWPSDQREKRRDENPWSPHEKSCTEEK